MKLALDFDGVITEAPSFFATVTHALRAAGHEIYIVTDHDEHYRSQREAELRDLGIAYDELVIRGQKERYCQEQDIRFALDDDAVEYYPNSRVVQLGLVALGGSSEPRV